jgi:predicted RNA-binding Zn ribbon-like protein
VVALPAPIVLDPNGYGGSYKLIGGSPALDFANLVSHRDASGRSDLPHDWLDPPGNLARWIRAAGIDTPVPVHLEPLVELREALAEVLLDVADGRDPRGDAFHVVATAADDARARQRLSWDAENHRGVWMLPHPALQDVLALDAATLLTDDARRGRIGACDECRWLYLDTTRNRSRRWCDPADCGNRARQRRHYHRQR